MNPKRIHVKLFLEDPQSIAPETAFKIFNNWIAEIADEVLVDVADYSHVHAGPATLLVGHQSDYSLDNTDGQMGLLYCRKQPFEGDLAAQLRQAVATALSACRRLEDDPQLEGRAKFRGDEFVITLNDRLNAPNTSATLEAVKPALEAALEGFYDGADLTVEHLSDPKGLFALRVRSEGSSATSDMLANLAG